MSKSILKKDLTIKEMYLAKHQLQDKLFEAVKQFEEISGCLIMDIAFTFSEPEDEDEKPEANGIELDIRLNDDYYEELSKDE